jgi:hypothetical protein
MVGVALWVGSSEVAKCSYGPPWSYGIRGVG